MEAFSDLDTFAKILSEKGYNGYFHTEGAYPGKLKDSISGFLEACRHGADKPLYADNLLLRTYLEWNGGGKPNIQCLMRVKHKDGRFDVRKMDIERTDRYGQLIKKSELTDLTTDSVPTTKEAIAHVTEKPRVEVSLRKRGFRM